MAKNLSPTNRPAYREQQPPSQPAPARPTTPRRPRKASDKPSRSQVYSLRLSEEEQSRIEAVAERMHLPASTLVRAWILERLETEER